MIDKDREEMLRGRLQQLSEARRQAALRAMYAPALVESINSATGLALRVEDFGPCTVERTLDWPEDIRNAPGLVLPYVSRAAVDQVLKCIDEKLGGLDGSLGLHDKDYLGFACVTNFSVRLMSGAAAALSDSMLFYPNASELSILVDCYGNDPKIQFSIVVQGDELSFLRECFISHPVRET